MVIKDEAADRLHISLFSANAIMQKSDDFTDFVEQQRFGHEDSLSVEVMRMKERHHLTSSWRQKIVPGGVRPIRAVKDGQKAQITAFGGLTPS